jgi:alpha-tubulin suppressor-like RCC1 family protein
VVYGKVYGWSKNDYGQLGDGTMTASTVPVQVQGLRSGATAVTVSTHHVCAIVKGAVYCWGTGPSGQLGNGTRDYSTVPVTVAMP